MTWQRYKIFREDLDLKAEPSGETYAFELLIAIAFKPVPGM
jgi:hypothetical protein